MESLQGLKYCFVGHVVSGERIACLHTKSMSSSRGEKTNLSYFFTIAARTEQCMPGCPRDTNVAAEGATVALARYVGYIGYIVCYEFTAGTLIDCSS